MMLPGPEAGVELQADTVLPGPGASMRVVNHMSAHGRQPDVDAALRNISPMTVHIPIKFKWFDEISSGKKFHEYRRMCDHWTRRLFVSVQGMEPVAVKYALFRVGYASNTSALLVRVIKITEIKARDIPAGMGANEMKHDDEDVYDMEIERMVLFPSGVRLRRPRSPPPCVSRGSVAQKRKIMAEERDAREAAEAEAAEGEERARLAAEAAPQRAQKTPRAPTTPRSKRQAEPSAHKDSSKKQKAKEKILESHATQDDEAWVKEKETLIQQLPQDARPDPLVDYGKFSYTKKINGSAIQVILRNGHFWCTHKVGGEKLGKDCNRSFAWGHNMANVEAAWANAKRVVGL